MRAGGAVRNTAGLVVDISLPAGGFASQSHWPSKRCSGRLIVFARAAEWLQPARARARGWHKIVPKLTHARRPPTVPSTRRRYPWSVDGNYRRVVLTSGHLVDAVDRPAPRFPPWLEPAVAAEVEAMLDRWEIGPQDLVLNGAARGADILFAESAHRRGAALEFVLASPPDQFERSSVDLARSIWGRRFRYLLSQHPYRVVARAPDGTSGDEFARANVELLRRARELCPPGELFVGVVWDEQPGEGPGGTAGLVELAAGTAAPVAVINPTRL
jgi:hypothetical protein